MTSHWQGTTNVSTYVGESEDVIVEISEENKELVCGVSHVSSFLFGMFPLGDGHKIFIREELRSV